MRSIRTWSWMACAFAALVLSTVPGRSQAVTPPDGRPVGIACAYQATLPTLLSGQVGFVQCDASGRIIISNPGSGSSGGTGGGSVTQGTSPWVDNITQWAGTALGTPTTYGTAPTGNAPGVNAAVTNFPSIQAVSGTVTAQQPSGGTYAVSWTNQTVSLTTGSAAIGSVTVSNFPTTQAVSGSVSVTNFPTSQPVTNAGTFAVQNNAPTPAGTALIGKVGIDQTTPGTTNAVAVTTSALPTGAATATNQTSVQGSVTGGTAGSASTLDGGVYNSTGLGLSNGQQAALQLSSVGNLKAQIQYAGNVMYVDGNTGAILAAPLVSSQPGGIRVAYRAAAYTPPSATNSTALIANATRLYKFYACNASTAPRFLKVYNAFNPTVGTATPQISRVLPGSATAGIPLCQSFDWADVGMYFSTGLSFAFTTTSPDSDAATAVPANTDITEVSVETN